MRPIITRANDDAQAIFQIMPHSQKLTASNNTGQCYMEAMNRAFAIAKLHAHQAEFKQLGVERLYIFGSTARGEARHDSDVDLFFDYQKGKFGLFDLMDLQERASTILGCKADIMTRDSLHNALRQRIEATAVCIF